MIDPQIMLITGTRKGIGRYLAEYYAKKGFRVFGCSREPMEATWENYHHFCLDVCDEQKAVEMFSEIRRRHKRLDVLINNAAVNVVRAPMALVPYEAAVRTLSTNVLGTFLMSREGAKLMIRNSYGRIINIGSMAVAHELKGEGIYTASKSAVASLTRVMAKEMFQYGITCNVVAPSAIRTDLLKGVDQGALDKVLKRNAIQEIGHLEDISHTIDWLIGPGSGGVTSQIIYLGGV